MKMNYAIILSGGIGSRMKMEGVPKQYLEVNGRPIILYTLEKFDLADSVDKVVIVANPLWQEQLTKWMDQYGLSKKFAGYASQGECRQESILNGLLKCVELSDGNENNNVIIHDAVRPCLSVDLIDQCLKMLDEYDGCMPVIPVSDTTYFSEDGNTITKLLERQKLYSGQAPEAFRLKEYYDINKNASKEELMASKGTTEIAFAHGMNIRLIPGESGNFKITTKSDLERLETVLKQ